MFQQQEARRLCPAFCNPPLLPEVSVRGQKSGRTRARLPPDGCGLEGVDHSEIKGCIQPSGPVGDQDTCGTAVSAREEESSFFDGAQPGTGGCKENSVTEGIVTGYSLRSYTAAEGMVSFLIAKPEASWARALGIVWQDYFSIQSSPQTPKKAPQEPKSCLEK